MVIKLLSGFLAIVLWLVLVTNFMDFMAGALVIMGSLTFMLAVAEFFNWLLQGDEK